MKVAVSNVTATAARFTFTELAGGATGVDVQIAHRPDFRWCVAPIFTLGGPPAFYDAPGLNQRSHLYVRARETFAGGGRGAWSVVEGFRTGDGVAQDYSPANVMIEPVIIMVPAPVLEWAGPGTAVAGFAPANLGRDAPVAWKDAYPHAGREYHEFSARLGGAQIDTVALLNSNMPEAAKVRIIAGPTKAHVDGAGPYAFDTGEVPFRASTNLPGRPGYHGLFDLGQVITPQWVRVILYADLPGAVASVEHAVFGFGRKSKNHAVEKKETPLDLGSVDRTRSGNPDRTLGLKMRRVEFDIALMTESQFETLYADLGRRVGETEPVLVVPNSKRGAFLHDRILYGNLSGGAVTNPSSPRFTRTFQLDSII